MSIIDFAINVVVAVVNNQTFDNAVIGIDIISFCFAVYIAFIRDLISKFKVTKNLDMKHGTYMTARFYKNGLDDGHLPTIRVDDLVGGAEEYVKKVVGEKK